MANKVFISFRYCEKDVNCSILDDHKKCGHQYKEKLEEKFEELEYTINKSESEDRSGQTEETIKKYLYEKLADTSLTIMILTPEAVEYNKDFNGKIDDWLYDELRYSLEDRGENRTNAVIALYTEEAKEYLIKSNNSWCSTCQKKHGSTTILSFENLIRKNMFNVKSQYKHCSCDNLYDTLEDHYISLVSYDDFYVNPKKYIDNALEKRDRLSEFEDLVKRMN